MKHEIELSVCPELIVEITATGPRGQSAYEAACAAGFDGTEQDFNAGLSQAAGGATVLPYAAAADFPPQGRENALYLDCGANKIYRYSRADAEYYPLGLQSEQITLLHGGGAAG